jgi:hypothetical protein
MTIEIHAPFAMLTLSLCAAVTSGCASTKSDHARSLSESQAVTPTKHGGLQVIGNRLCDSLGNPIQLKGMSTMGLQWHGEAVNDAGFVRANMRASRPAVPRTQQNPARPTPTR